MQSATISMQFHLVFWALLHSSKAVLRPATRNKMVQAVVAIRATQGGVPMKVARLALHRVLAESLQAATEMPQPVV